MFYFISRSLNGRNLFYLVANSTVFVDENRWKVLKRHKWEIFRFKSVQWKNLFLCKLWREINQSLVSAKTRQRHSRRLLKMKKKSNEKERKWSTVTQAPGTAADHTHIKHQQIQFIKRWIRRLDDGTNVCVCVCVWQFELLLIVYTIATTLSSRQYQFFFVIVFFSVCV